MVNYQNGKIYKIEDVGGNMCYIGSTTKDFLSKRMVEHRSKYKTWCNDNTSIRFSVFKNFQKYGVENCRIVLIELFPCDSKDELTSRESHFMHTIDCVNKVMIGRTKAEWARDNHPRLQEKGKNYRSENQDKIRAQKAMAYQRDKDTIMAKTKIYQEKNKEHRQLQRSEVHNCECGKQYTQSNKSRHMKLKHHIDYIANIPLNV